MSDSETSDSESSSSEDTSDSREENGREFDSESESETSDSSSDVDSAVAAYNWLLEHIRRSKTEAQITIRERDLYQVILENIDQFCEELSSVENACSICLGVCDDPNEEKLDITPHNAAAWNKFFNAVGALAARSLEKDQKGIDFILTAHCVSVQVMAALLRVLPAIQKLTLYLPWHGPSGSDMRHLLDVISNIKCRELQLTLDRRFHHVDGHDLRSSEYTGSMISNLLCAEGLDKLKLNSIALSLDECRGLATVLSSSECTIRDLTFNNGCRLLEDGGRLIADAVKNNTSLKQFYIADTLLEDEASWDEIVSSVPLNTSIERLYIHSPNELVQDKLVKNVALKNTTLKILSCLKSERKPTPELETVVARNHSLEIIFMAGDRQFETITRLNRAGRRYLREDATSKSKCIDVLANVKDDLSCLYYHLRENPVLFTSNGGGPTKGKKRKADEALGGASD